MQLAAPGVLHAMPRPEFLGSRRLTIKRHSVVDSGLVCLNRAGEMKWS